MTDFVDRIRVSVKAGAGGKGAISFRKEAHVPRGGPDGGDGGRGGSVIFRVDPGATTLSEIRFARGLHAEAGAAGKGKNRSGGAGSDLIVRLPPGTVVRDLPSGALIADLTAGAEELVAARGGRGGRGNARFASSTRQVPRIAEDGEPGEEREIELELKLIADVGLAGLPNAGKSTLLAALTRATPKIAAYPFTTLVPNLGVARLEERELVIADIPGLIEGAHRGAGLGEEFLRHIERTRLIVHVVDASSADPLADLRVVEAELAAYGHGLTELPRIVALNKLDLAEAREAEPELRDALGDRPVVAISAATGEGVVDLNKRLFAAVAPRAAVPTTVAPRRITIDRATAQWTIEREEGAFRVRGTRIEQLAAGIDWSDPDASAYFQRLLVRNGVDRELRKRGVRDGDTVRMGELELEWREAPA